MAILPSKKWGSDDQLLLRPNWPDAPRRPWSTVDYLALDSKLARARNVPSYQCERNGRNALLRGEELVVHKRDVPRHPDARALRDRIEQHGKSEGVSGMEGDRKLGPVEERCERRDLGEGKTGRAVERR